MTIQEAINSGKRFKRPYWGSGSWVSSDSLPDWGLSSKDILANDWEVENMKKELSADDIARAINKSIKYGDLCALSRGEECPTLASRVIKELGL